MTLLSLSPSTGATVSRWQLKVQWGAGRTDALLQWLLSCGYLTVFSWWKWTWAWRQSSDTCDWNVFLTVSAGFFRSFWIDSFILKEWFRQLILPHRQVPAFSWHECISFKCLHWLADVYKWRHWTLNLQKNSVYVWQGWDTRGRPWTCWRDDTN